MEQLNQIKKFSPVIAGIALVVYSVIGLIGGGSFLTIVYNIGILVAGITCFIEKTELVRVIALGICAVSVFVSFIIGFFGFLGNLFGGYFGFFDTILFLVSYLSVILEFAAVAIMAVFVLMQSKGINSKLTKYWYVPAGILLISTILGIVTSFILSLIYGGFSFAVIFRIFGTVIVALIIIVGFAALGLSQDKSEQPVNQTTEC